MHHFHLGPPGTPWDPLGPKDLEYMVYQLKYDSVHKTFGGEAEIAANCKFSSGSPRELMIATRFGFQLRVLPPFDGKVIRH